MDFEPPGNGWLPHLKKASKGDRLQGAMLFLMHRFKINDEPGKEDPGLAGKPVTSMTELLGRPVSTDDVKPSLLECIAETFDAPLRQAADIDEMIGC